MSCIARSYVEWSRWLIAVSASFFALASFAADFSDSFMRANAQEAEAGIERMFADPDLQARISTLGLSVEEVRRNIDMLSAEERVRVAAALDALGRSAPEAKSSESRALYLALIALMREQRLFHQVVSQSLLPVLGGDGE